MKPKENPEVTPKEYRKVTEGTHGHDKNGKETELSQLQEKDKERTSLTKGLSAKGSQTINHIDDSDSIQTRGKGKERVYQIKGILAKGKQTDDQHIDGALNDNSCPSMSNKEKNEEIPASSSGINRLNRSISAKPKKKHWKQRAQEHGASLSTQILCPANSPSFQFAQPPPQCSSLGISIPKQCYEDSNRADDKREDPIFVFTSKHGPNNVFRRDSPSWKDVSSTPRPNSGNHEGRNPNSLYFQLDYGTNTAGTTLQMETDNADPDGAATSLSRSPSSDSNHPNHSVPNGGVHQPIDLSTMGYYINTGNQPSQAMLDANRDQQVHEGRK